MQYFDRDADEFDEEPDWLDDDGLDEEADDSEPTIACPHCRQEIYEDAELLPALRALHSRGRSAKEKVVVDHHRVSSVPVHRLPMDRRMKTRRSFVR